MNIEEAKEKLHNMAYRDLQTKPYDLKLADVMQILNQIEFDQPKPEVPQCVAEWLEGLKKEFPDNLPNQLYHVTRHGWGNGLEYKDSKTKKMKTLYNCGGKIKKDLVNALIYGYTIKKEKLYTVEIPNPNREGRGHAKFVLERQGNKVFLVKRKSKDCYYNKNSNHLTEQEIRKDFDWAWQFAKEVTE